METEGIEVLNDYRTKVDIIKGPQDVVCSTIPSCTFGLSREEDLYIWRVGSYCENKKWKVFVGKENN